MKKRRRKRKTKRMIEWNRAGQRERPETTPGSGTLSDALTSETKAQLGELKRNLTREAEPPAPTRREPSTERRPSFFEALMSEDPPARAQWPLPAPPEKPGLDGTPETDEVVRKLQPDEAPEDSKTATETRPERNGTADPAANEGDRKSFRFWEFPEDARVREAPPETMSEKDRTDFDQTVSVGPSASPGPTGERLWVLIGLDFGASSSKVIVRLPYEPGQPTVAVPAPVYCRSSDHPYLWQTVVWVHGNGVFVAYPERHARALQNLKQGIMGKSPTAPVSSEVHEENGATRLDAAAAYLACVIRYVRGWLFRNRPAWFRGRRPHWLLNLGLAAAWHDDEDLFRTYRKAAATALILANSGDAVTVETIRAHQKGGTVARAVQSERKAREELGIAVIPETAAAATGFAKSPNCATGLYLMVDVGSMTLDVCTFRLNRNREGRDQYPLLWADVKPLGIEAFHWFRDQDRTEEEFVRQCRQCLGRVVRVTRIKRDPKADCWKPGNTLPVFLTGGGARNRLHRDVVRKLHHSMKKNAPSEGIRLLELPVPATIDLPQRLDDMSRMAVAYGLSYPHDEIGRIHPPSTTEDFRLPEREGYTRVFVSKEQV